MEDYSPLALAFLGDASYSLYVRRYVIDCCRKVNDMQHYCTRFVSATAQAGFIHYLLANNLLSEEETSIYKRGRNAHAHAAPKNASAVDYHCSTGFETLWGYWEVNGQTQRQQEVFEIIKTIEETAHGSVSVR